MGTPTFAVPVLEALIKEAYEVVLVVTQPDRPVGRKRVLTAPPVKELAVKHEIPVYQPESLRHAYEEIFTYEPDIIITCAYGQLLPKALLDYPEFACINVHASLLPELRGGAPIHHAILQGKKETGVTIMYMVEKLDAGNMISKVVVPIDADDHVGSLHDKLSPAGAALLIETLPAIFSKTNDSIEQDEAEATFASNISREDEKIDWSKAHTDVYNHIRGLHPWPVAYGIFQGKRMKIWWGDRHGDQTFPNNEPGDVVAISEEYFTVVCGDQQVVHISDIQLEGKKRMSVSEFLRGNPEAIQIGDRLE